MHCIISITVTTSNLHNSLLKCYFAPNFAEGWLVGWSLTSLFSTNMAISETKCQEWTVILLPSEGRLVIY